MKCTSIHIICKSLKKAFQPVRLALLVLLITIGAQSTSSGQQFPVRVNTFITPPYSIYLSDYTAPESNSLTVMLSLRDLDRPQYQTKLRIKLEGSNGITIQTIPGYTPPPIVLSGGITETLTGYDLRNYLNPDNLEFEGITRADFIRSGTLPEGFYTLTVEALDYNRNVVVSNSGMANAWFVLNDPPLINLPFDGEKVRVTDPQNVMFSWTPRHTASPNAAFNTEYKFKLVEIYPEGRNPNDAILASNSIYETTTTTTSLNYSITEPLLIPGRTYAFRIRAYDIDGRDLFKNQGYSEVYTFKFGEACKAPENVTGEAPDPDRMKVSWDTQTNHTEYVLRHRKRGSSEWFSEETFLDAVMVPGLETSSTYEYQVQARCEFQESEFSSIETVTTPEIDEDEFVCGSDFVPVDISTSPLLVPLLPAMTIKTADFRVIIKEATQNQDGTYAGTGWAMIPWFELATVRVKFNNIRINSQLEVFDGQIVTVYSNNSRFVLEDDTPLSEAGTTGDSDSEDFTDPVDDFFDGYDFIDTVEVDYDITDVTTNDDGDIVITYEDANGDLQEEIIDVDDDESGDILVTDESGNSWAVDENGDVSESPANEPDPISDPAQVDYIVQFTPSANQSYGFDYKTFNGGEYDELTIQDEDYIVAYKSVESARTDIVTAVTSRAEFPTEVGFKSQDGLVTSSPGQNNNEKQISINGKYAGYEETIDAYVNIEADGEDEELLVGRLNVVTYDKVSPRVVIVPVNGVTPPNAEEIANTLNGIYKQAVVEWHVRVVETYEVNQNTISGLTDGQSGMVSSYTPNMRSFNQAFRDNGPQMDDNAFYLFLVSGADAGLGGFMPFKRQFGYIFTDELDNYTLEKAIAHELGHGAFRLRHTFSPEDFKANQNSTDNLMDYAGGTQLKKYQWDLIHSPENMNGWFEEDEESELDICFWLKSEVWAMFTPSPIAPYQDIYDEVKNNFDNYWDRSAELFEEYKFGNDKENNLALTANPRWTIRNATHYKKTDSTFFVDHAMTKIVKQEDGVKLHPEGITLARINLDGKDYRVAAHSLKEIINPNYVRVGELCDLVDNDSIQVYNDSGHSFIVFLNNGSPELVIQILTDDEDDVKVWLKYMGILVEDESSWLPEIPPFWENWSWENVVDAVEDIFSSHEPDDFKYIVTDKRALVRKDESGYDPKEPEELIALGEQSLIIDTVLNQGSKIYGRVIIKSSMDTLITSLGNLTEVIDIEEKEYKLNSDFDAVELPYSTQTTKEYTENESVKVIKECGGFVKVKESGESIKGHWINKFALIDTNVDLLFTDTEFDEKYPNVNEDEIKEIFTYIEQYRVEYGVDNCKELIHFLAQADHESGGFYYRIEQATFTGDREKYKGRGIFQLTHKSNYKEFQEYLESRGLSVDLINHPELVEKPLYSVLAALRYWERRNLSNYATALTLTKLLQISKLINCGNLSYCGYEKDENGDYVLDENDNKVPCTTCNPNGWDDRKEQFEKYKDEITCN